MSFELNQNYRTASLILGLEPPIDIICPLCGKNHDHKVDSPSLVELQLQASVSKDKNIRKMQIEYFNALIDRVTLYEQYALETFKLPKIDFVREAIINDITEYPGTVEITTSMEKEFDEHLRDWQYDLVADREFAKQDQDEDEQEAIYNYYALLFFTYALERARKRGILTAPKDLINFVENVRPLPNAQNAYLRAVKKNGLKRIKIKIKNKRGVKKILKQMAKEGKNPLEIGRMLHKKFEGEAWYWNRLARSESALAMNVARDEWARQAGVLYYRWVTGGSNPCPICLALHGQMWKAFEAPYPVSDTHPNCACDHEHLWIAQGQRINPKWERQSPYDLPYQIDRENNTIPELLEMFRRP